MRTADRALRLSATAALLALTACEQCPPPRPEGGTPGVRDEVSGAVDRFYAALGSTRICVTRLELAQARAERAGHYSRTFRAVGVDEDTDLGPGRVATHELCHALDHQHDVRLQQDELWTYDIPREDLELDWVVLGESFADTCEVGPLSIQLVGESCEDDTRGSRAWQVLQRWFPEPVPEYGATEVELVPIGSWTTHVPVEQLQVTGTADRTARIDVKTGVDTVSITLDLLTGEPTELALPSPLPEAPELPEGWTLLDHAGDGERTLALARMLAPNGGEVDRVLWLDPTGIQALGCTRAHEVPFFAYGQLWSAWAEGEVVHWGRWAEADPDEPQTARPRGEDRDPPERID